ncbi:MAG: hypothetical protein HRT94_07055 [Alphaproteobacteria bacterium]|nr:hypothetical protein [Alphaproteobacteria bacterium]
MPLISTLPRRDNPATGADFRSCLHVDLEEGAHEILLERWNKFIEFSPSSISTLFADYFDQGFRLAIKRGLKHFKTSQRGTELEFTLCIPGQERTAFQTHAYDFGEDQPELIVSEIKLPKEMRGKGLGTRLDEIFTDLNIALGVRRVSFIAYYDHGAFVWPLNGYHMNMNPKDRLSDVSKVSERVRARISVLENIIPDDVFEQAMRLAQFNSKEDVSRLANMTFDLEGYISSEDFDCYDGFLREALRASFRSIKEMDLFNAHGNANRAAEAIMGNIRFCKERGKVFTLGGFSLIGERLECLVDYDDDKQVHSIFGGDQKFSHSVFASDVPVLTPRVTLEHRI